MKLSRGGCTGGLDTGRSIGYGKSYLKNLTLLMLPLFFGRRRKISRDEI
jgi:hypothetical protein